MAHRFLDDLAMFDYIYHFIAIEKGDFPCLKFPEGPKKGATDDRLAIRFTAANRQLPRHPFRPAMVCRWLNGAEPDGAPPDLQVPSGNLT